MHYGDVILRLPIRGSTLVWQAALAALGAGLLFLAATLHPAIEVVSPEFVLGQVQSGATSPVAFSLRNTASKPVAILGAGFSCTKSGCGLLHSKLPLEIQPDETVEVKAAFQAHDLGPFSYTFTLYTDAPNQGMIPLSVRGQTIAAASGAKAGLMSEATRVD